MKYYAKIINNETKQCDVADFDEYTEKQKAYFESAGMTIQDVEQAYTGQWYIEGFAPEKPESVKAAEVRQTRDNYLKKYVDPIQLIIRWNALTQQEQTFYTDYRQYLLDIPQLTDFPNITVLSFEEWKAE